MPIIENTNGFHYKVIFSIPSEDYDQSCYISGNFNCNGDGSISLERNDGKWTGEIYLQPGEYSYYVEIDQYFKCDENRRKRKTPLKLTLPQKSIFHDQNSSLFYSKLGGRYMVKVVSPVTTKELKLVTSEGKKIEPFREHSYGFMKLFIFVLSEPVGYTFESDGQKYPKRFDTRNSIFTHRYQKDIQTVIHKLYANILLSVVITDNFFLKKVKE
ncbi:hypothetical protein ACNF40_01965 [Cuniculiplasma sp. SKW4]|uniref:hypothetical protein n=1 Tax=Cuniculiplasma sp. SKW4 TaxID=3400171 RepID=UPI003FCF5B41